MTDASTNIQLGNQPPLQSPSGVSSAIPVAITVPATRKRLSAVWLLTIACAALSAWLIYSAYRNQGEWIEIEFDQGHGLQPADSLRFRGIEIGRIEKIDLRTSPPGVLALVRLTPNARSVVTDGTRFWIARPVISLDSIQGLETVIGPKYIAMEPGKGQMAKTRRFVGLEAPPSIDPKEGSIEIVLDSKQRHGLTSGAPILHRGFRVGDVLSVELASDARSVIMRAAIDPEYHELVRSNSKFWVRSGWRFDLGLRGIRVVADSLGEILYGGIEFASPDSQGTAAATGTRFELHDEPLDEWLDWQPSLPFGARWDYLQSQTQPSHRVALRWKEKSFGFRVDRQRTGWALMLDDGTVVCRDDLVTPPKNAIDETVSFEFAGTAQTPSELLAASPLTDGRRLIKFARQASPLDSIRLFEAGKVALQTPPSDVLGKSGDEKKWQEPVDVLILGPELTKGLILDSGRMTSTALGWQIDSRITVPAELDSAPVLESSSGRCLGCLNVRRGVAIVALIQDLY
jgi:hypothetical protein